MNEGGNGSRNTPRKEVQVVGYPMRGLLLLVLGVGGVTMLLSGLGVTLFADYEAWHVALAILLLLVLGAIAKVIGDHGYDLAGFILIGAVAVGVGQSSLGLDLYEHYGAWYLLGLYLYPVVGYMVYATWSTRRRRAMKPKGAWESGIGMWS